MSFRYVCLMATALVIASGCDEGQTNVGLDIPVTPGDTRTGEASVEPETRVEPDAAVEISGVACKESSDCDELAEELGACRIALCDTVAGACVEGNAKTGTMCDDEDQCTEESFCKEGECIGGAKTVCDDSNPCTTDSCDGDSGCKFLSANGIGCDDGNPCTEEDNCQDSACAGTATECGCEADEDCAQYDDGDLCHGALVCDDGTCAPEEGAQVICPPSANPCQQLACQPDSGACEPVPAGDGDACSDGDPCTDGDYCAGGECQGGSEYVCGDCTADEDCTYLDEANKCIGKHICTGGECVLDFDTAVSCPQIPCFTSSCSPATGECVVSQLPDGIYCTDADACTSGDKCEKGACKGDTVSCNDDNGCTKDSCDAATGCSNAPLDEIPCDDDNACTEEDWCDEGNCAGQAELVCDDDNPCTEDTCSTVTGCVYEPLTDVPCDDGQDCTEGDSCMNGVCAPGENTCQCDVDGDCVQFDDLDLCNGSMVCVDTQCIVAPDTVVVCDTTADTDCKMTLCNPVTGSCEQALAAYGAPCLDDNECTVGETCFFGDCLGGIALTCDDENPCTQDSCEPDVGCLYGDLDDVPCDDGDPCTVDDICTAGECASGEDICQCEVDEDCEEFDDADLCNGMMSCVAAKCVVNPDTVVSCEPVANPCQENQCKPATGLCELVELAAGTPCDDEDECTENDVCFGGECQSVEVDCDDDNPCTADSCGGAVGCVYAILNGEPCEDGSLCTEGDVCEDDECVPGENTCDCTVDEDCAEKNDDNLCNGVVVCNADHKCELDSESVVKCDDSLDSLCEKNTCTPETGECQMTKAVDGTECDDGLVCTLFDICTDGKCAGEKNDCNDNNPCTDDVCVESEGGCVHYNNDFDCSDDSSCTTDDVCSSGKCVGTPVKCDDDNPCTKNLCAPLDGCYFEATDGACDDEDACTKDDQCIDGGCVGQAVVCDDTNPCTDDVCEPDIGCTAYDNKEPCEDGDACTMGDVCALGECTPGPDAICDDEDPCTKDSCNPAQGCQHEPDSGATCDDGNPCTLEDICVSGVCAGPVANGCDDDNTCTADSCSEVDGCLNAPQSGSQCDDGDACTKNDVCAAGTCAGSAFSCDDEDPCTDDLCNPDTGCVHKAVANDLEVPCSDNNGCTQKDVCIGGQCSGSDPKACTDNNVCTNDSCIPLTGECDFAPNNNKCSDVNGCTVGDACVDGSCQPGVSKNCNDNNSCTDDSCDETSGQCVNADNGTCQCQVDDNCQDDDNKCNGYPICVDNVCVTKVGSVVECSSVDDTECAKNTCEPDTGSCVMMPEPPGGSCSDSNACTDGDQCDGNGSCVGAPIECDDDNICTNDTCNQQDGCQYQNNDSLCDDNDPCTVDDQCGNGVCDGVPFDCDDGNVCTSDDCVIENGGPGCLNLPTSGICDDQNACSIDDHCVNGLCMGAELVCDDNDPCTDNQCDPTSGCVYPAAAEGTECDDGNVCTGGDLCANGQCQSGDWLFGCCLSDQDCNDDYKCSEETCDNGQCQYSALDCSDGNACTAEWCKNGECDDAPLREPVELYFEDFDDGAAQGWRFTTGDGTAEEVIWSVDDERASSQSYSLYGGDPETHTYNFGLAEAIAYTPPLALPENTTVTVSFQIWAGYDPTDGVSCNFDVVKVQAFMPSSGTFIDLPPKICKSTVGFEDWSYAYANDTAKDIQFVVTFDTVDDKYNVGEGVYVDDFSVVAEPREDCCLYDGDCDDGDLCSFEICKTFNCSYDKTVGTYFAESFESGELEVGNGQSQTSKWWLHTDNEKVFWSVDDERSHSTPYSLYCGRPEKHDYDGGKANAVARTPMVSFPEGSSPILKFRLWTNVKETNCYSDFFTVTVASGPYSNQKEIYKKCGSNGYFEDVEVDLGGYADGAFLFTFKFQSNDQLNDGEGVYIDSIRFEEDVLPGCCVNDADCDDKDACTIDDCKGAPEGGICYNEPVLHAVEAFDDAVANNWTFSSDNNSVTWQVDNYRAESPKYSLYCGNTTNHRYYQWGSGTVLAATPYKYIDKLVDLGPFVSFDRYLSLSPTDDDCFQVTVQYPDSSSYKVLETVCGDDKNQLDAWVSKGFSLSEFAGQTIRIAFTLKFPGLWGPFMPSYEGAYIDNVVLGFEKCVSGKN